VYRSSVSASARESGFDGQKCHRRWSIHVRDGTLHVDGVTVVAGSGNSAVVATRSRLSFVDTQSVERFRCSDLIRWLSIAVGWKMGSMRAMFDSQLALSTRRFGDGRGSALSLRHGAGVVSSTTFDGEFVADVREESHVAFIGCRSGSLRARITTDSGSCHDVSLSPALAGRIVHRRVWA